VHFIKAKKEAAEEEVPWRYPAGGAGVYLGSSRVSPQGVRV
jgi:hypothetical protein